MDIYKQNCMWDISNQNSKAVEELHHLQQK